MIKTVFFDAGGVLFLNKDGEAVLNDPIIDFVKAQSQYTYGILSSTSSDLEKIVDSYAIGQYFSLIQSSGLLGIRKESPDFFKAAVEALNISPEEAVMVDNDDDFLEAASKAGLAIIKYRPELDIFLAIQGIA